MTLRLRRYGRGHCGEWPSVSGLSKLSSPELDSPPNEEMPRRRRDRRGNANGINHPSTIEETGATSSGGILSRTISETVSSSNERTTTWTKRDRGRLAAGEKGSRRISRISNSISSWRCFDWPIFVVLLAFVFTVTDACSTRPSPKPRPPRPIWSPHIGVNVAKQNCTDDYAALYCLNSGKCYRQKILASFVVSCECPPGYVGTRCQYRDIPEKYLPMHQRIETASIAGGVTVLIVVTTVVSTLAWLYYRRAKGFTRLSDTANVPVQCV